MPQDSGCECHRIQVTNATDRLRYSNNSTNYEDYENICTSLDFKTLLGILFAPENMFGYLEVIAVLRAPKVAEVPSAGFTTFNISCVGILKKPVYTRAGICPILVKSWLRGNWLRAN